MHPYARLALHESTSQARPWLERQLGELAKPDGARRLRAAYTGARRRLGEGVLELSAAQRAELESEHAPAPLGWTRSELGRAALLVTALSALPLKEHAPLVQTLYSKGDLWEQRAVLRALPVLPEPERFLATAVDACRTNVVSVFEGIACHNPYPERHFPDSAYNQLVLKAVFLEVPLAGVLGLGTRARPELARMARDYAAERRAAGRVIPPDLARIPGCENILT